jgi:uncharacterized protein YjiS (DUF1127 family)
MAYIPAGSTEINEARRPQILSLTDAAKSLSSWCRAIATSKELARLTPEQLRDIGYVESPKPTLSVKPGLMSHLMSMR